jgi:hypothetical protein
LAEAKALGLPLRTVTFGAWAPWITDPDPPEEPMTEEQLKAFGKAAKEWWEKKQAEEKAKG